ncbi:MAG: hypothetical protein CMO33_10450 [Verrucomicrobia bacterium]|nr:hypothetical protein [Verrucomicrobiota bacterium]
MSHSDAYVKIIENYPGKIVTLSRYSLTKLKDTYSPNRVHGQPFSILVISVTVICATLLLWADILARTLMAPEDMPIGIVTGLIGGLFFIWLLGKRRSI